MMPKVLFAALAGLPLIACTPLETTRDGSPGNPPSTATQRAVDQVTGTRTSPDGTGNNPAGTAAERALDRAAGTNVSGAYPAQSDGRPGNPPGTAVGRAISGTPAR